jgi:hypothetical protein
MTDVIANVALKSFPRKYGVLLLPDNPNWKLIPKIQALSLVPC